MAVHTVIYLVAVSGTGVLEVSGPYRRNETTLITMGTRELNQRHRPLRVHRVSAVDPAQARKIIEHHIEHNTRKD